MQRKVMGRGLSPDKRRRGQDADFRDLLQPFRRNGSIAKMDK